MEKNLRNLYLLKIGLGSLLFTSSISLGIQVHKKQSALKENLPIEYRLTKDKLKRLKSKLCKYSYILFIIQRRVTTI